jgi:hypothetical protein
LHNFLFNWLFRESGFWVIDILGETFSAFVPQERISHHFGTLALQPFFVEAKGIKPLPLDF